MISIKYQVFRIALFFVNIYIFFCQNLSNWYQSKKLLERPVRLREHKHLPPSLFKTQKTNQRKMCSDSPLNVMAPPVFDGTNYQVWAVRMEAYLDANDQ
jgi:hypothetical protein